MPVTVCSILLLTDHASDGDYADCTLNSLCHNDSINITLSLSSLVPVISVIVLTHSGNII